MTRLRAGVLAFAGALGLSLLLARVHPFGDARIYTSRTEPSSILTSASVPADVRATLAVKCADCHSMETHAPFYGRLAPMSWLMERDIVNARQAMNLSRWSTYPESQKRDFAAQIVHETRTRDMPVAQYRIIHWRTRITDSDVRTLTSWANAMSSSDGSADADPLQAGNAERGKLLFDKRCSGCHSMESNKEGPYLRGVYGRISGTAVGYDYSSTLKNARVIWKEDSLDQWLADPDAFLAGNNMDFHITKEQERRDLIQFLKRITVK